LDRTKKRPFTVDGYNPERFLVCIFPASEKFDSDLELNARMHKTDAHPCPPMNNNIAPMPTQNPWVWVSMGMGMGMGMGGAPNVGLYLSSIPSTLKPGSLIIRWWCVCVGGVLFGSFSMYSNASSIGCVYITKGCVALAHFR
jgi:hypothetical protein